MKSEWPCCQTVTCGTRGHLTWPSVLPDGHLWDPWPPYLTVGAARRPPVRPVATLPDRRCCQTATCGTRGHLTWPSHFHIRPTVTLKHPVMKAAIFWCVTPWILVNLIKLQTNLVLPLSGWNVLKTGRYSETCRYLYQTTRRPLSNLKNTSDCDTFNCNFILVSSPWRWPQYWPKHVDGIVM